MEKLETGEWPEKVLFLYGVQGDLPLKDPDSGKPYSFLERKEILLTRIERRLGKEYREKWKNGFFETVKKINWSTEGF